MRMRILELADTLEAYSRELTTPIDSRDQAIIDLKNKLEKVRNGQKASIAIMPEIERTYSSLDPSPSNKGEKGDKGEKGNKGDKGDKGDKEVIIDIDGLEKRISALEDQILFYKSHEVRPHVPAEREAEKKPNLLIRFFNYIKRRIK